METTAHVGRNEPCPCGSGKKYKTCCAGRVDVVTEAKRSPAIAVGVTIVALALAGVIAVKFLGGNEAPAATVNSTAPNTPAPVSSTSGTPVPTTTPPVTFNQNPAGTPSAQPPGPAPAGKVWSADHGHWHDANPVAQPGGTTPLSLGAIGAPAPTPVVQPSAAGTPQPAGPAPEGKVWSAEHGHWHDAPGAGTTPQ